MAQHSENARPGALIVGARGWEHPGWQGSYYPDDLPEDWRLAYYANDFRGVLVPASFWTGDRPPDWHSLAEDTSDPFRFFLELPAEPVARNRAMERLSVCAQTLGARLGSLLVADVSQDWIDGLGARHRRLCPLSASGTDSAHWALDPSPGEAARLEVALLSVSALSDMRRLRSVIEALAAAPVGGPKAILLTGSPPDSRALDRLKTLVRLMGLA